MRILIVLMSYVISSKFAFAFDHTHANWSRTLKDVVVYNGAQSTVDYKKLAKNSSPLNLYLKELQKLSSKEFETFTVDQKKAFWINAYNAFTLKIVTDYYPVKSIKDIGSVFKSTWKIDFIIIMGKTRNLDYIEHKVLRPEFKDPRIHFAINCASISCPRLRNEAFTAEKLEAQLEEQTKDFLTDPERNTLDTSTKTVSLSKIFDWFSEDFQIETMTAQKFIAKYITNDPAVQSDLNANLYTVKYLDYNWSLNDIKKQ